MSITTNNSTALNPCPMIWVGSLAAYNAGHLVGEWVTCAYFDEGLEDVREAITAAAVLHGYAPADWLEELSIMDRDDVPEMIADWAGMSADRWRNYDEALEHLAGYGMDADTLEEYAREVSGDLTGEGAAWDTAQAMTDNHSGELHNVEDWAHDQLANSGDLPARWLREFVDFKAVGEALLQDYYVIGGHLFHA